jgi:uncharacterized protein
MRIQLETGRGRNVIRAYAPGEVRVNETVYTRSVVVTPDRIISDWPPERYGDLDVPHFEIIVTLEPEIVLLGTGTRLQFPLPSRTLPLIRAGIGVEVMDTAAACRTYNILMEDGRRVVAALLMI